MMILPQAHLETTCSSRGAATRTWPPMARCYMVEKGCYYADERAACPLGPGHTLLPTPLPLTRARRRIAPREDEEAATAGRMLNWAGTYYQAVARSCRALALPVDRRAVRVRVCGESEERLDAAAGAALARAASLADESVGAVSFRALKQMKFIFVFGCVNKLQQAPARTLSQAPSRLRGASIQGC
jgi:hypothetical protein